MRPSPCLALLLCMLAMPSFGQAGVLYCHDDLGNLFTLDVASGQATLKGNSGMVLTDIAFNRDGRLYGIDYYNLYEVNPQTAEVRQIGPVAGPVMALVFDENGHLWAAGGSLIRIDPATGQSIQATSLQGYQAAGDLAFDSDWNLYLTTASGHLLKLDRESDNFTSQGLIPYADVYGFARAPDGTLYGVTGGNLIISINPATGQATDLRPVAADFPLGYCYGSSYTTEALPEPATLLLLSAAGVAVMCRRHC